VGHRLRGAVTGPQVPAAEIARRLLEQVPIP
jgi:hypothetical protein